MYMYLTEAATGHGVNTNITDFYRTDTKLDPYKIVCTLHVCVVCECSTGAMKLGPTRTSTRSNTHMHFSHVHTLALVLVRVRTHNSVRLYLVVVLVVLVVVAALQVPGAQRHLALLRLLPLLARHLQQVRATHTLVRTD